MWFCGFHGTNPSGKYDSEKPEKGLKNSEALIMLNPRGDLILPECSTKMQPGLGLFSEFLGPLSGKTRFGIRFFTGLALPSEKNNFCNKKN